MTTRSASTNASRIFISYRRDDSEQAASRVADELRRHFADEQIFQDFSSIDPGADFVEAVQRGLDTCAAVIVVVVPAGSLLMGSPEGEPGRSDDEGPQHTVTIQRRVALARFPVLKTLTWRHYRSSNDLWTAS